MQYVEGETLASHIRGRPLELTECLEIAKQAADALSEAHSRGIIHRDIKPQNIMITARGQVKVLDFGLAKLVRNGLFAESKAETDTLITEPGAITGTLPYMSPEQVRGETLDARTDIFSFGVVLYEILSGHQPFQAESAAETVSAILSLRPPPLIRYGDFPAELQRITFKCLEKDRERRYQSARDLLLDLGDLKLQLLEAESIKERALSNGSPQPVSGLETKSTREAGNRQVRKIITLASLILFTAVAVIIWRAGIVRIGSPSAKSNFSSVAVLPLKVVCGSGRA